jgi:hypothetical protein
VMNNVCMQTIHICWWYIRLLINYLAHYYDLC